MSASRGAPRGKAYPDRKPIPPMSTAWMNNPHLACVGSGVDFGSDSSREQRRAKQLCRRCPECVRCLNHALQHREAVGVWGGLLPEERAAL